MVENQDGSIDSSFTSEEMYEVVDMFQASIFALALYTNKECVDTVVVSTETLDGEIYAMIETVFKLTVEQNLREIENLEKSLRLNLVVNLVNDLKQNLDKYFLELEFKNFENEIVDFDSYDFYRKVLGLSLIKDTTNIYHLSKIQLSYLKNKVKKFLES